MLFTFATLAFATLALATPNPNPVPAGVSSAITPPSQPAPSCAPNYKGAFEVRPVNVTSASASAAATSAPVARGLDDAVLSARFINNDTHLGITLKDGILKDPQGRTGYVASNQQWQFDDPPQAGAIYTAGFSACEPSNILALGSQTIWYSCLSGTFHNIYFKSQGGQCFPVHLVLHPVDKNSGPVQASSMATVTTHHTQTMAPSNSTMSSSSSSGSGSSSSSLTGAGATTKKTAVKTATMMTTASSSQTTGGAGSSGGSSSAATASASSGGAAKPTNLHSEMFGLAVGALALAVI